MKRLSRGYGQLVQSDFGESTLFHHRKSVSRAPREQTYKTIIVGGEQIEGDPGESWLRSRSEESQQNNEEDLFSF